MSGWIKLHRKIQENDIWMCDKFSRGQAWVDLILNAAHKPTYFFKRGIRIDLKRGQLAVSETGFADRWKWSRTKVRTFLKMLEKEQQISLLKNNVIQVITVLNYEDYQEKKTADQTADQTANWTRERPQKDTYKNVKNVKNIEENNSIVDLLMKEVEKLKQELADKSAAPTSPTEKKTKRKISKFIPPSLEQIREYCNERKNDVDPVKWFNHYTANGWKVGKNPMKDWKAAIRTWERNNINKTINSPETTKSSLPELDYTFNPLSE